MELTGSEIVLEVLAEEDVDTVFGYPGGNILSLYDALGQNQKGIRHILTAHEQGASHCADGYARAGGKVGVVIATSGPGVTNLMTGLATANADSVPMVAITGSVPLASAGTDSFQEIDTASLTLAVTKYSYYVRDVKKLAYTLRKAFQMARSGRPGPVLVDIPHDVQKATCEFEAEGKWETTPMDIPAEGPLSQAAQLINESQRPVFYCGGGVINSHTAAQVRALAEKCGAYVAFSMMGVSAMEADHPLCLGMTGMYGHMEAAKVIQEADVVFAVGVRFSDRGTGNREGFAPKAKIIHLDIDYAEQGKLLKPQVEITGDFRMAFDYLLENVKDQTHPDWDQEVARIKEAYSEKRKEGFCPRNIIEAVNAMTPGDTPVATDVGQHQMWVAKYYHFRKSGTLLTSGGFGTMGYGMGASIGAALSTGKRSILFTGDGSFCMNMQEVTTAVRYQIPVTVLVMDNGGLGMIRQLEDCFCDGRRFSTELGYKTDFARLAEAMGAKGFRVHNLEELKKAYQAAQQECGPVVIDCIISEKEFAYPMIPPNQTVEDRILG
ncbi:MAG TPA: biosynthetic-type acetolactate synthase large subunit [Firmicutes bacterium]|nr:biosynthetic-type acetolactate synthase large subunit [Bacillota bacterium]